MVKRKRHKKRKSKKSKRSKAKGRRSGSLPVNPKKGQKASIVRRGRRITFKATGKKGFGKWKIVSNEAA